MAKDTLKDLTETPTEKPDKKPKVTRKRQSGPTIAQIKEGLEGLVGMVGAGITIAGDPHCGAVILERGPAVTDALVELAKSNPKVKRSLQAIATSTVWGGVAISATALVVPILAHHGIIPEHLAGLVGGPPSDDAVEPGGARYARWPDGSGQDDTRPGDTPEAEILSGSGV